MRCRVAALLKELEVAKAQVAAADMAKAAALAAAKADADKAKADAVAEAQAAAADKAKADADKAKAAADKAKADALAAAKAAADAQLSALESELKAAQAAAVAAAATSTTAHVQRVARHELEFDESSDRIGEGAFAVVYCARWACGGGQTVAFKRWKAQSLDAIKRSGDATRVGRDGATASSECVRAARRVRRRRSTRLVDRVLVAGLARSVVAQAEG